MKKLLAGLTLLVAGVAFATPPYQVSVTTNSTQLVPKKNILTGDYADWEQNKAYAQGDVVKSSGLYFFATAGGTSSTNALTSTTGAITDGTVTWINTSPHRRTGVAVSVKTAGGTVDLSFGTASAVATNGLRLTGEGHAIIFGLEDQYQGEIHAITSSGTVVLGVQEF